jgi:menaquinone-dependent protoporphyrinogen oxidase
MSKILVAYGSTYRQTRQIAHRIANILWQANHAVHVCQVDKLRSSASLVEFDCILLAAPARGGHYQKLIREFARRNATLLNRVPSALVSVCAEAAGDPGRAEQYIDGLCRETGWYPKIARSFTGVDGTRCGWPMRWYLKHINRWRGLPTTTSRAWEFTDWSEVDRFARSLASTWGSAPAFAASDAERQPARSECRTKELAGSAVAQP